MGNARGDEAKMFLRAQAAFAAAEAAADGQFFGLPFYSLDMKPTDEVNEDDAIYGDAYPGDQVAGLSNLSGALVAPVGLSSIGHYLQALLGAPETTELVPGSRYQHVFKAKAAQSKLLHTLGVSHTKINTHSVSDSVLVTGFEHSAKKEGQRARASFDLLGRAEVPAGAALDATPVGYAVDPVPVGFKAAFQKDGADVAGVTGLNFSLKSGIEMDQETLNGTAYAADVDAGQWKLEGGVDSRYRDNTWIDLGVSGQLVDLSLAYAFDDDHSLSILMHNLRIQRSGVPINNRGIISSSFSFMAARPNAGEVPFTATLVNKVANYDNPV